MNHHQPRRQEEIARRMRINEYTVFQDLSNVTGIAAEVEGVLETLPPDNTISKIQQNRLIVQVNLSNSIHVDTYNCSSEYPELIVHLNSIKTIALNRFMQYHDQFILKPEIRNILRNYYTNNIIELPIQHEIQLIDTGYSGQLQQSTIDVLQYCMSSTDMIYSQLRSGTYQYKPPTDIEIMLVNESRKNNAICKLQAQTGHKQ